MTAGLGDYLLGCAGIAAIGVSMAVAATPLRRRLLPGWTGPPARLAEAILALALLTLILELLGTIGILTGPAIVIGCAITATASWVGGGKPSARGGAPAAPPTTNVLPEKLTLAIAIVIPAVLFIQWSMPTLLSLDRGIYGGDSLWYHMPFAASFAQSGSITSLHFTDPLYLNWFYPQNSELLHAAGITLFGNDFLSPLLNLGWLALALLAAWCIGRPYGAAPISLVGVAIILAANLMFSRQPGNANNDVVGLALLLAAVAILVTVRQGAALAGPLQTGVLVVAGLAAGLALGTKLTFVVPVAALTIGVIAIAERGTRGGTAAKWTIPLLLGGGWWYARNLIVAGNPLPWMKIGMGPVALPRSEALHGRDPFSVAHYATDTGVWRHFFFPGLSERFGALWPLVVGLATLGVVLALWRGGRVQRMLAAVALVTAVAYVFTPLSASGPAGHPLGFRLNLRYLAPALGLGLVLLAAPAARLKGRESVSALAILVVLVIVLFAGHSPLAAFDDGYLVGALLIGLAATAAVAIPLLAARGAPPLALVAGALALALVLVCLGWGVQRDYTAQRYALDAPRYPSTGEHPGSELSRGLGAAYQWARGERDQSIALGGTTAAFFQYGLYGPDSSNRVTYLGQRGPRGSLQEIGSCSRWRQAIDDGGYRFVVTSPGYNQDDPSHPLPALFAAWTGSDPAAVPVVRAQLVTVFEISRPLDPKTCR